MTDAPIAGVDLIGLTTHADARGSVTEVYREGWFPSRPRMVQSNLSLSHANVLRGLHFHRRQADLWVVQVGAAFVGLHDLRAGSPTAGRAWSIDLDAAEGLNALYVPPGVAHGFYARSELRLQYFVDVAFTGEDEFGIAWDDPALGIVWPATDPVLSDRDRSNPSLAAALIDPPAFVPGTPEDLRT